MKYVFILVFSALVFTCSDDKTEQTQSEPTTDYNKRITELETQILALNGTQQQITNFIASEYDTCANTGDTADSLVKQICKVAKSANATQFVQFKAELAEYSKSLKLQIDSVNDSLAALQNQHTTDIDSLNTQITSINGQITTINSSLTSLNTRMTSAENAITALQTLTNSINNTLNNLLELIEIGTENLAEGPLYETVQRKLDKSKIVAYVESFGASNSLSNNPLTATNGSNSVKITFTNHGVNAGELVLLSGLVGSRGFTNAHVTGYVKVATVIDVNNFTFTASVNASSNGTLGGNSGSFKKVLDKGLAIVWETVDGADVATRVTSYGNPYNFIVKSTGFICYDKTDRSATFATINANGSNIVCK